MYVPNTSLRPFLCPLCGSEVIGMGLDRHIQTCEVQKAEEQKVDEILRQNPELSVEVVYSLV